MALLNRFETTVGRELYNKLLWVPLFLDYHKGFYYSMGMFVVNTDGEKDSLPRGLKILSINGNPIDTVVLSSVAQNTFSWDVLRKKPYARIHNIPIEKKDTVFIYYEYQEKHKTLRYIKGKSNIKMSGGAYFFPDSKRGFVEYFPSNEILYIRLPAMVDDDGYYKRKIIGKFGHVAIKKVVIDIRQNGGGSDLVWMDILSVIIKDTLDIKAPVGLKNTDRALNALGVCRDTLEIVKVPLLDNEEFVVIEWGSKIVPHPQSINYTGKIYVLQDRGIYSAAGSLSNVAQMYDNIVSVGETTGRLLGFGVAPIAFTLPNSYFTFQLEPVLDLSNAETLWDYYHDKVEVPIDISVAQRVKYFNSAIEGDIYSKDFLFNHDPVFQKVLELED
jgi:C-terminal processing protease CtpA/Prc